MLDDNDNGDDENDDKTWIRGGMPSEVPRGLAGGRNDSKSLRKPDDESVKKMAFH